MGRRLDDIATIDWKGYVGTQAVLPVCMKSPAVNGRRLKAQLISAAERLDNLIIVVCDSLDRHNYTHLANAKDNCISQGDEWLSINLPFVKEYFPKVDILRWEKDIRSHHKFSYYLQAVEDIYNQSQSVRQLQDSMSLYYLVSKKKRFDADWARGVATKFDTTSALKSSFDYLTEEFAGDMVYHKLTGGIPHIYWGLYVDDHEIFQRESKLDLGFPQTLPVTSRRLGPSVAASELPVSKLHEEKKSILDSSKPLEFLSRAL